MNIHLRKFSYLSKIISPTGDVIQFNYKQTGYSHPIYVVNEQIFSNNYPYVALDNYAKSNNPVIWTIIGSKGSNSIRTLSQHYTLKPLRLVSIVTENQIVKFVHNTQKRADINGEDYSLQKIEVYLKNANNSEKLLKRFCFDYGYFGRNLVGGNTVSELLGDTYMKWFGNDDFMHIRLKLNKVWEEGVSADGTVTKRPAYIFSYHPTNLPCKASAAIDYWGYYNGKDNKFGEKHTLIPMGINADNYDGTYNFPDEYLQQTGANRLADANAMKACMLTSIQYPTGAVTTFEYEPHSFTNYNYRAPSTGISFNTIYVYSANMPGYTQGAQQYRDEKEFNVSEEGLYKLSCKFMVGNFNQNAYWKYILNKPTVLERVVTGTNQSIEKYTIVLTPSDTLNAMPGVITKSIDVKLKKGRYKLSVTPLSEHSYPYIICQTDASVSYNERDQIKESSIGGGIRIKCITTKDGGNETKTTYDYNNVDESSSGILMAPVINAREKMVVYQSEKIQSTGNNSISPHTAERRQYWVASGSNMAPPSSINVAYSRVTVTKTGGDIKNGKSVFEYHNNRWANSSMYDYMRRIEDPLNGKLILQTDYDETGKIVKKTSNTYLMNCVESRLLSAVIENIYVGPSGATGGTLVSLSEYADALGGGCMQIYLYPSVQFSLTKHTATFRDYFGEQEVLHSTETTFNQVNHLEATIKESTSRAGESHLIEKFYPTDYITNSIATTLKNNHIINTPIESISSYITSSGQSVTAAERTEYNSYGCPTYLYNLKFTEKPRSEYRLWDNNNGTLSWFERVTDIAYNTVAKPRIVSEYGHEKTVYIWGYCGQYPIAVIKGATQEEVTIKLGGQSNLNALEKALVPTMTPETLHSKLVGIPGALVTTYEFLPLIGLTKTIAPNGEKTIYEYDSLGRLVKVIDHNGVVIQQQNYNYKRKN